MLKRLGRGMLYLLVRAAVGIRYRVKVRGLEKALGRRVKGGGVLFLPNHPAAIDPVLLTLVLWHHYLPHPLVVENFYYMKGVHTVLKRIGAVPIPDLSGVVNRWKQKKVEGCFQVIEEGLRKGDHYLIYPAGRLKLGATEVVGGASFAYNLLKRYPDTNVVLVRTTGLWGSRFSRAITGQSPDLFKVFWEGVKITLKNLIFLTPRREVTIDFECMPDSFLEGKTRLQFNQALEKWYNSCGPEPLKLVSDHCWNEAYPEVAVSAPVVQNGSTHIDPQVAHDVMQKIADLAKRQTVEKSDHLAKDLGLDSLDFAELQTFVIQRYDAHALHPEQLQTVEDVLCAVAQKEQDTEDRPKKKEGFEWPKEESRPPVTPPEGDLIPHAFLKACDRMRHYAACADERMGVVSYRKLKLLVMTLEAHFRKTIEEKQVGVLLPSSTLSYAIVLALLLADKIPVMLNWTVGARALNHCKEAACLKTVISSTRFLEHLTDGDLGAIEDLLVFMEEIKPKISWRSRFKGVVSLFQSSDHLIRTLKRESSLPTDPAVILFTSGTESVPKGVPLSHQNILSNQTAGLSCIDLFPSDVLYGVLPPFHSFGFSVTGLFPLLIGLRVFYAPDPTQYFAMAKDIAEWQVSVLCSAPTFMKGLFHVAKRPHLQSVRLAVGGAEKVSEELFQTMQSLGGEMLEGYGITECGPVVTLTRPNKPREGVGPPLPGVELCIVHSETLEKVAEGTDGEICIRGPNVFSGYLGSARSPFLEIDGKKWYRSGDRGHLTPSGALVLTGRLKRFIKIGGEMVSLTSVEEELLTQAVHTEGEGPPLAVVAKEPNSDKPQIIVFATFSTTKDKLNEILYNKGFGRLIKVSEVRQLPTIPLMGTGKINYRTLEENL